MDPLNPVPPVNPKKPDSHPHQQAMYTRASKLEGSECFKLWISLPKVTGQSMTTSKILVDICSIPKDYHDFADMFSKSKAGKLADHRPYNLKITLDEGTSPPFGPIDSLSQEELAALHKVFDDNFATGFICPSCSPHGALVPFIPRNMALFNFLSTSEASTRF